MKEIRLAFSCISQCSMIYKNHVSFTIKYSSIGAMFLAVLFAAVLFSKTAFAASPNTPASDNTSYNWSGYVATGGTYTGVNGTWTVPSVSATESMSADASWVGIGGVSSKDLIQAGTQTVSQNGQISYSAWIETLPQESFNIPLKVDPGDSISVWIDQESGTANTWMITFRNNTTGVTYATSVQYNSSLSSAEWIEEMPILSGTNSFIPIDNFSAIDFRSASTIKNGTAITMAGAGATPITMVTGSNNALVTASGIGSDGMSFSAIRTSTSANIGQGVATVRYSSSSSRRHVRTGTGIQGFAPHQRIIQWQINGETFRFEF